MIATKVLSKHVHHGQLVREISTPQIFNGSFSFGKGHPESAFRASLGLGYSRLLTELKLLS